MSLPNNKPTTNAGLLKITDQEIRYLESYLQRGDRGGYYMALYNMTGSEEALLQAQISTFSEGAGGTAYLANALMQQYLIPAGEYPGIYFMSQAVAEKSLEGIKNKLKLNEDSNIYTGYLSDDEIFDTAAKAWKESWLEADPVNGKDISQYFPGNLLAAGQGAATTLEQILNDLSLPVLPSEDAVLQNAGRILAELYRDGALTSQRFLEKLTSGGALAAFLATMFGGGQLLGKRLSDYEEKPLEYEIHTLPDSSYKVAIKKSNNTVVGVFENSLIPNSLGEILNTLASNALSMGALLVGGLPLGLTTAVITTFVNEVLLDDLHRMLSESEAGFNGDVNPLIKNAYPIGTGGSQVTNSATTGNDTRWGTGGLLSVLYADTLYGGAGNDTLFGGDGNDELHGNEGSDIVYGQTGDDTLYGEDGVDTIRGGAGADTLYGGKGDDTLDGDDINPETIGGADTLDGGVGNDLLVGGNGNDTYKFRAGDGQDTVVDSDGQGRIDIGGIILSGGKKKNDGLNVWQSTDDKFQFTLVTESNGTKTLVVMVLVGGNSSGDRIFVKNFVDGNLGIFLQGAATEEFNVDHFKQLEVDTSNGSAPHGSFFDALPLNGSYSVIGTQYADQVRATSYGDLIQGGGGFDEIYGGEGDDRIYGDVEISIDAAIDNIETQPAGSIDVLEGETGDDILIGSGYLYGGGGSDILIGSGGDDVAQGDTFYAGWAEAGGAHHLVHLDYDEEKKKFNYYLSITEAGTTKYYSGYGSTDVDGAADTIYTGGGNDIVLGELGDDYLVLGTGNDFGLGGEGSDTVEGEEGNDYLFGDFNSDPDAPADGGPQNQVPDYRGISSDQHGNDFLDGGDGNDYIEGNGGDDVLVGGDGADRMLGDDQITAAEAHGNDTLEGGDGDDFLLGSGGDDQLYGGEGNDRMFSDDEPDILDSEYHGVDYLEGGGGNDSMVAGGNDDVLYGGTGNDVMWGDAVQAELDAAANGKDFLDGEDGDDEIAGGGNDDQLFGGDGNDVMEGDAATSIVAAAVHGNDSMDGGRGDDYMAGGGGDDWMYGGDGDDEMQGDAGDVDVAFHGDDILDGGAGNDTLFGGSGNDQMVGGTGQDYLLGDAGDDTLSGENGNDELQGGDGNDRLDGGHGSDLLFGENGNDVLNGAGGGDDYLDGGDGDDTYLLFDQDGLVTTTDANGTITVLPVGGTTIADTAGTNKILFGAGIVATDLSYLRIGDGTKDFALQYRDDVVSFANGVISDVISLFEFSDGTIWTRAQVMALAPQMHINAGAEDNDIIGSAHGDILYGGLGDDFIRGAGGNDSLNGGEGSDTYLFNLGDGQDEISNAAADHALTIDRIEFGNSIVPDDIVFNRISNNLLIKIGINDSITLRDYFSIPVGGGKIDQIKFVDNTLWTPTDIEQRIVMPGGTTNNDVIGGFDTDDIIHGLAGNDDLSGNEGNDKLYGGDGRDYLFGGSGNDLLDGGQGNDELTGGLGNDTFVFGPNGGADLIRDSANSLAGVDIVQFSEGLTPDSATVVRENSDLIINFGSASLRVERYFDQNNNNGIQEFRFTDGTVWSTTYIRSLMSTGSSGYDYLRGYNSADVLDGKGGNDDISISRDDMALGGTGNDNLGGSNDNTYFEGGAGNDIAGGGFRVKNTHFFERGDGQDAIGGFGDRKGDVLIFGELIAPEDLVVTTNGNDLLISISGSTDTIILSRWFDHLNNDQSAWFQFNNGVRWSGSEIESRVVEIATVGNDRVYLGGNSSFFNAGDGDDTITGTSADEILEGGNGNDVIEGRNGDDVLVGGFGNDTLYSENGNDVFVFNRGDGNDIVYQGGGENEYEPSAAATYKTLRLGVNPDEIYVSAAGAPTNRSGLIFSIIGTTDSILFFDWLNRDNIDALRVEFADGTVWETLTEHFSIDATAGADSLFGTAGADTVNGGAGDDVIETGAGNDLIDGGTGSDRLDGGSGSDVYLFGYGSGHDTIRETDTTKNALKSIDTVRLSAGITTDDISLTYTGGTVTIALVGTDDSVTIYLQDGSSRVEHLEFADGTVWNLLSNPLGTINGTNSADSIYGTALNDVINGGAGNDYIYGGDGNDLLLGGDGADTIYGGYGESVIDGGAGNDRIYNGFGNITVVFGYGYGNDYASANIVRFNAGVTASDIRLVSVTSSSLLIQLVGSTDTLELASWFIPEQQLAGGQIFEFADGTRWNQAQILAQLNTMGSATSDFLFGTQVNDVFSGQGGNDELNGYGGNDVLNGGIGADILRGDTGDDILDGGTGNDILVGGVGSDTYLLSRGFGYDRIIEIDTSGVQEKDSINRIVFGPDITPEDIVVTGEAQTTSDYLRHLYLTINGTNDRVSLEAWFTIDKPNVDRIEFSNGVVWTRANLLAKYHAFAPGGTMVGSDHADIITGANAADDLSGGDGNDTLSGMGGDDHLMGEAGDDILSGGVGADALFGGIGDDTYIFERGFGQDSIADYDRVSGGADKILFGSNINSTDVSVTRNDHDIILSIIGTDDRLTIRWYPSETLKIEQVIFGDGVVWDAVTLQAIADNSVTVMGTIEADVITGDAQGNILFGLAGDDVLIGGEGNDKVDGGMGDDHLDGGSGVDLMRGGAGNDVYVVDIINDEIVEFDGEGLDKVESGVSYELGNYVESLQLSGTMNINGFGNSLDNILLGNGGANSLSGKDGDDIINGGYGDDILSGDVGADILSGDAGNDKLIGGAGSDLYLFKRGDGQDTIADSDVANNISVDVLEFGPDIAAADISFERVNNDLLLWIGEESVRLASFYDGWATSNHIEEIHFADGTIWNREAIILEASKIFGTDDDDLLIGTTEDDWIDGLGGMDQLEGGYGDDVYVVDNTGDLVIELQNSGWDTVNSSVTYTLASNIEYLTLIGSDAINGTGNNLSNDIVGNNNDNVLDGAAGSDSMAGGAGNDTYVIGSSGDTVTEYIDEGIDLVRSSVTYTLSENVENITLTGSSSINATGNELSNYLTGNSAINTLTGGDGNDTLDGAAGADKLRGEMGDDIYLVDNVGDVITENVDEGLDVVFSSVTHTLAANVENLTLVGSNAINATGNALVNLLTGNAGANTLNGGIGADIMSGGIGNDIYVVDNVGDVVAESEGEGTDLVQSNITYTLNENIENLTLTGTAAIVGYGNSFNNAIAGNSGNNILDGGAGADTMSGGAGNDIYVVDNAGDVVTENASAGTDLVQSSLTYMLGNNVENLTLTGTTEINATGNTLNNALIGNAANNTLDGGAGADSMAGKAGDDAYIVDNTGDTITELSGEGIDSVQSSVTYTLSTNVENLTLTGATAINGTGNASNNILMGNSAINTLTGGAGNDLLNGGAGADKMSGGTGDDIYVVDNATDVVTELASAGIDSVQSSVTHTLASNVEALALTGVAAINGTGNTLNNLLLGNAGNNTLNGAAGNDILQGGAGTDALSDTSGNGLLDGGAGNDTLTGGTGKEMFMGGTGNDTITTSTGADIIAFNLGDGQDTVIASTGKDNTVSLGKGIKYADLLFQKSSNDLVFITGAGEQLTFKNWYVTTNNHSVANLQMVIEGTDDYNAASANTLNNKKIQQFNFDSLVTAFDQARVANPALTSWALSSSLLGFHLGGSDTAAIGGDLTYEYAKTGNLSAISMTPAQSILANAQFGAAQNLVAAGSLQDSSPRLM